MVSTQLSPSFLGYLSAELSEKTKLAVEIKDAKPVSGGDISAAFMLTTNGRRYFMKLNSQSAYPLLFERESEGLDAIRQTRTVAVPQAVLHGAFEDNAFLVLAWIETGAKSSQALTALGQQLAAMHRCTASHYGFEHDNYMGSLPQSNTKHTKWADFFINERLQPMVQTAADRNLLSTRQVDLFEQLYARLPELFAEEQPALIHGDLWGGNYLVDTAGKPYLIDPAVSYGHREFDLAMTTLFGGFSSDFYAAYHEAYPLAPGWQQRAALWNLYPLLLHLNLFGASYLPQVIDSVNMYL
ncbi:fructosamine kinase family protein [Mucilaginibacter sp. CSA2-8R]|uniref:fructosamine kinase family protein n=1 Tax=Mucilaginibacter sp. CSA2-8R TaxID=3141542 RepID=UPI00315D031E